jgi:hypothetical protein
MVEFLMDCYDSKKIELCYSLKVEIGLFTLLLSILAMIESTSTKPFLVRLSLPSLTILGTYQSCIPRCICLLRIPSPSTGLGFPL